MVKKSLSKKENKKNKTTKHTNILINDLNKILFTEDLKYFIVNSRTDNLNFNLLDKFNFSEDEHKLEKFKDSNYSYINHWEYLYKTNSSLLRTLKFYKSINLVNNFSKIKELFNFKSKYINIFTHGYLDEHVLKSIKTNKNINFDLDLDLIQGLINESGKYRINNYLHILNGKSNKIEDKDYDYKNNNTIIKTKYSLYNTNNLSSATKLADNIGLDSRDLIYLDQLSNIRDVIQILPVCLRIQKRGGCLVMDLPYISYHSCIKDIILLLTELYQNVTLYKNIVTNDLNMITLVCFGYHDKNNKKILKDIDNLYNIISKNKGIPDSIWDYNRFESKDMFLINNVLNSIRVFSIMSDDIIQDYIDLINNWKKVKDNDILNTRINKNLRYLKKWFKSNRLVYKGRINDVTSLETLFPQKKGVDLSKLQIPGFMGAMATPHLQSLVIIEYIEKFMNDIYGKKNADLVITDATAGIGGDTINFAQYFKKVNSVEYNDENCKALKNNIQQYKLDNINVTCNDYNNVCENLKQDVVFIDAPWGLDYKNKEKMKLYLGKLELVYFVNLLIRNTDLVILKVPNNYDFMHFFKKLRKNITATVKPMSVLQNYYYYIFCYKI